MLEQIPHVQPRASPCSNDFSPCCCSQFLSPRRLRGLRRSSFSCVTPRRGRLRRTILRLTEAGEARASALAAALADANVQAVITTQLARTRDTGRPVAEARHVTPEVVSAGGAGHAQAVADAVRRHAGQTVLVVGHSNTVPAIVAALGGPKMPDICDSQYSSLYTLVLDGTSVRLVRGSYGAASPDPTDSRANAMR